MAKAYVEIIEVKSLEMVHIWGGGVMLVTDHDVMQASTLDAADIVGADISKQVEEQWEYGLVQSCQGLSVHGSI